MNETQMVSIEREAGVEEPRTEAVQEPLSHVAIRIELKSERVQETLTATGEPTGNFGFVLELAVPQQQPVTIELAEPKVTITLYAHLAEATSRASSFAG